MWQPGYSFCTGRVNMIYFSNGPILWFQSMTPGPLPSHPFDRLQASVNTLRVSFVDNNVLFGFKRIFQYLFEIIRNTINVKIFFFLSQICSLYKYFYNIKLTFMIKLLHVVSKLEALRRTDKDEYCGIEIIFLKKIENSFY